MTDATQYDWRGLVAELNALLRLKTTVIGMKLFENVEDMEAIHTTDQIVSMASRLGWTVGVWHATAEDVRRHVGELSADQGRGAIR